jgi:hypothetical protein
MRTGPLGLGLLLGLGLAGAPMTGAEAQFPGAETPRWGPRVDSVSVAASTRGHWRGYLLGGPSVGAVADVALWGYPVALVGDWGLSATMSGFRAFDAAPGALLEGRLAAGAELNRRLGLDDARLGLTAGGYLLPWSDDGDGGFELGLALRQLPIPWLPELWPTLDLEAAHDFGTLEGTQARASLGFMPGFDRYALLLQGDAWADDRLDGGFELRAWQIGLGLAVDLVGSRRAAGMPGAVDRAGWRLSVLGFILDPAGESPTLGGATLRLSVLP